MLSEGDGELESEIKHTTKLLLSRVRSKILVNPFKKMDGLSRRGGRGGTRRGKVQMRGKKERDRW